MPTASVEELREKADKWNMATTKELLPAWCFNVGRNRDRAWNSKNFKDWKSDPMRNRRCIIVASAPGLKDETILELLDYNGDIIVCNKMLERFVKLGVQPAWCILLDSDPISTNQFEFMNGWVKTWNVKFLVSTIAYPYTVKTINQCNPDNFYMFNPQTDTGGEVAISKTWEWLNGCPSLCHGGNVGGLAFQFAKSVGYEEIALLGFGFYEELNPGWTMKEAGEREFFYYPDIDRTVAIPFHFLSYSNYLMSSALEWKGHNEERRVINLSESPVMRHSPVFTQEEVGEYVERSKGI